MFKLFCNKTNNNPSAPNLDCNHTIFDIKENLIDIKNNIEQIRESNYKENQINWKFILTTAPLYFSLLAFFAILIGALKTHSYLNSIGYISIFSETMTNPSALVAIVVAYSLMVFLLLVYFALPFLNFMILNHSNKFFKSEEINNEIPRFLFKNLTLYSIASILTILWFLNTYFNWNFLEDILGFIFIYCTAISICFSFKCKSFSEGILIFSALFFIWLYSCFYPIAYLQIIALFENRENRQWCIILAFIAIPILINIFSFFVLTSQKKLSVNKRRNDIFMGIVSLLFLLLFSFILTFTTKFSDLSLYVPRFIEKPKDASWYLIHNGNTVSNAINGMTTKDIKKQKELLNADECQKYLGETYKEKCTADNQEIFRQRETALYGYMAWNLGNTKVFCPVSVDFFDDKSDNDEKSDDKEKSQKCLVIDSKYLQLISEHYLN
ncbi:hypothetical protein [Moraxella sp. Pampa]|uniref:hypothetical protein n=1 Tax=Moraxella sp. Pampa TaxID=3111978 RepID=UPI002B406708|nr:hypothetical protein [Moraxella sp. Pampa]